MAYKIIVQAPRQGIERSLPYVIEGEFQTGIVARALDALFEREGYKHRVEVIPEQPKFLRKKRKESNHVRND